MAWSFGKKENKEKLITEPIVSGSFSYYIKKLDGEKFHTIVSFEDDADFWRELTDNTIAIDLGMKSTGLNSHKIRWNAGDNQVISERIADHMEAVRKIQSEINERQIKLEISREELYQNYIK